MTISDHAIQAFRNRTGCKYPDEKIKEKLLEMYSKGQRIQLRKKLRVGNIIRHGFVETIFIGNNGWVMVISDNIMRTIYKDTSKRFRKKNG